MVEGHRVLRMLMFRALVPNVAIAHNFGLLVQGFAEV